MNNMKNGEMFFADRDAVVEWIIRNQFGRRNLTLYDRTKLALRLEEVIKVRAKANMSAGGNKGCQTFDQPSIAPIHTRDELAKVSGVSRFTVTKVKEIEKHATDEQKAALSAGNVTINKVYTQSATLSRHVKSFIFNSSL